MSCKKFITELLPQDPWFHHNKFVLQLPYSTATWQHIYVSHHVWRSDKTQVWPSELEELCDTVALPELSCATQGAVLKPNCAQNGELHVWEAEQLWRSKEVAWQVPASNWQECQYTNDTKCCMHNLLRSQHSTSCHTAIHLLLDFVKRAWRRGNIVTVLFINIKVAFPSVVVDWLLHDMRTRGVPKTRTDWIKTKLVSIVNITLSMIFFSEKKWLFDQAGSYAAVTNFLTFWTIDLPDNTLVINIMFYAFMHAARILISCCQSYTHTIY